MAFVSKIARTNAVPLPPATEDMDPPHTRQPTGHVVQFYESDVFLAESVATFIGGGLGAGEAALVIATPAHRQAIEARLEAVGFDVATAQSRGVYVALDAAETLSQFIVEGTLEPSRFSAIIGGIVARVGDAPGISGSRRSAGGRRLRIFGEMVALLWADRNAAAAVQLEELWNGLHKTLPIPFTLCCAYPMGGFADVAHEAAFLDICAQHSQVVPDEGYTALVEPDERLRVIAALQQKARSLEAEIAERQVTEARLRASEDRYRRLFEASTDGILIVDPETRAVTDANPAMTALLGCIPDQVIGQELWQIGLFPDRDAADEALHAAWTDHTLRREDAPLTTADGQVRSVEFMVVRFQTNGHDVIQCNIRDVTERRELERRTREALLALLAIAASVVECSPTVARGAEDTEGALVDESQFEEGAAREREVAQRLAELTCRVLGCFRVGIIAVETETERLRAIAVVGLSPEQEAQWWAEQRQIERQGAQFGAGANPDDVARFRAGEVFVLDMNAPPYHEAPNPYGITTQLVAPMRVGDTLVGLLSLDYGGPPHSFSAYERALAGAVAQLAGLALERERLLHARAAAEARAVALEETTRQMDDFLGIASHELRTPLTTLKANLQMAERRVGRRIEQAEQAALGATDATALQTLISRASAAVGRQERLVGDLLEASRLQAHKLDLHIEPLDLTTLARDCVEEQRLNHPQRAITLTGIEKKVFIAGDADRVRQVLTNYLTNALKYSPEHRPIAVDITVGAASSGLAPKDATSRRSGVRTVTVRVRDEGPGLPPEEQERIWARFHRAPGVRVLSGSGVGLGLGLYIARELVERQGGSVGVASTPGVGSTFWFTFPLVAMPSPIEKPR
ncbi:MAG TPA: ATP-binding protein [Ktedonobacterales bacterium]|nr:ATP-binding protein [Ktedonobacterales bacterium]